MSCGLKAVLTLSVVSKRCPGLFMVLSPLFLCLSSSAVGLRVLLPTSVLGHSPPRASNCSTAVSEPPGLCPHFLADRVTLGHGMKVLI